MDPEDESVQTHLLHNYTAVPTRSQIIYKLLLDSLRSKDIGSFKNLVEQSLKKQPFSIDINYPYPSRSDETCLDIACKNGLPEFVRFLLEKGAKVNTINEAHNRGPIHFATENGHVQVLGVLLDEPTLNPNLEAGQQTALHMAVKKNDLNCAELLIEKGASPNIPNNKGLTALHMAAMKGQKDMVNLILQKSKHGLDLDNYKDYNNQTTRDVLQKKFTDIPLPAVQKRGVNVHDLKYYLNANDEANFLKSLKLVQDDVVNNVAEDLIEMAVQRNFKDTVAALLERTKGNGCSLEKSAIIAIQQGLPNILRQILNMDTEIDKNLLLLNACVELGIPGNEGSESMSNRLECLKIILERDDDVDVRCADSKGNTPLHYAARANCREAVTLLLEKGSYIGQMNNFGVPPVEDISVSMLSQYFDDCIQARKERTNEYTIEFDYKCLMPHEYTSYQEKNSMNQGKREMDIFRYIADNSGLKHLLKHPLLSSFLYLKWHKIRYLLYLNFAFYVLFYLSLNAYILHVTYIKDPKMVTNSSDLDGSIRSTSVNVLQILTGILLIFLALRKILQLISSPCHYVSSFEYWLEMTLIFLGFATLCDAGTQFAVVAILLSAWELIILIGQHPRMSTGIEMFKTVSLNFMRFLFLYAFLIFAFALAFFTLFKNGDDDNFPDPGHSLFKTIIMLTGELDANDIPFLLHPVLSHLVFVLFVFLIAIVLFNLLNGLAVSDTADILGKAELVGLISRVRVLAYIENVAVTVPFIHGPHCCICYGILHGWKWNPFAFLREKVLLFPKYLKSGKLSVKPYDSLEAFNNRRYYKVRSNENSKGKVFPTFKMDPHIIKQAKEILSKRGQESDSDRVIRQLEMMKERLALMEITLNTIKQGIENNNFNVAREDD